MKKRLLITSIVMMLVVAVALSTATYAWFTSNARVDAASITLKADTSSATALGIGWAGGDASTSIAANVSGVLKPMAPVALTAGTTYAGGSNGENKIAFFTQTTKNENSVYVFNDAGTSATPVTFGNGTATAFYVKNLSNANKIDHITITAVFGADESITGNAYTYALTEDTALANGKTYYTKSGDAFIAVTAPNVADIATYYEQTETLAGSLTGNDMVRVAIFRRSATASDTYKTYTDGDYKLIGVLGSANTAYNEATSLTAFDKNTTYYTKSGDVYTQVAANAAYDSGTTYYTAANTAVYGTISANGAVKDLSNFKVSTSLELLTDGSLNKLAQVDLMAIVWLDGSKFDDTRAGEIASVSLKFNA